MKPFCVVTVLALSLSVPAAAQVTIGPDGIKPPGGKAAATARRGPDVYRITVTPAPEPQPPLKLALLPRSHEVKPGNSVPFWYRALLEFGRWEAQGAFDEYNANADRWLNGPLKEFPRDEVAAFLSYFDQYLQEARTAATRRETEWDLALYELRGAEAITFLLHEVQESRTLARLIRLKARLAMAAGNYEEAVEWFRVNYRLAHDVAVPETLINSLVGVAIMAITTAEVIEFIGAPDSPNLYWALAAMPDPLIDLRHAYEYERTLPERVVPWLAASEPTDRTPGEWRAEFRETVRLLARLGADSLPVTDGMPAWQVDLVTAGLVARNYPRVKRDLIRSGMKAEKVEQMPIARAVVLHQRQAYRRLSQKLAKWTTLTQAGTRTAAKQRSREMRSSRDGPTRETFPVTGVLLPAFSQAMEAEDRAAVRPAALMVLEALRMHAFENGGKLPESLDEITAVPVPVNPVTGEPYPYRLDGDTAVIDVATTRDPEDASWYWRVELTVDPAWRPKPER